MAERIEFITGEIRDAQKRYINGEESINSLTLLLKCAHAEISDILDQCTNVLKISAQLRENILARENLLAEMEKTHVTKIVFTIK